MVAIEIILRLINIRVARLLDVAELALPPERFQKVRKLTLDDLAGVVWKPELERLYNGGKDRHD
jgi:hypothetical protein